PGPVQRGRNLKEQRLPATLPVGLPSELLERRPDVRQAEYRLRQAHAKVGIAFTSMFPKITLTGHYGLESNDLSDFLKAPYFFLGGELLEPVFNLGNNRAKLRAAKAVKEQEMYAYQKVVLKAFSEVSDALITSEKNRKIRESRTKLEEAARSALDLATLQYINGIISYLDVLDAQRGYFDAQIALNSAVRDELLAIVQLYKVLGGG
ncbi:MAG: TolC family protein, partial [Odoribacter sp.]|nr:TolC family protein [Odoribacter sp.]